jgi:hypothetical protein
MGWKDGRLKKVRKRDGNDCNGNHKVGLKCSKEGHYSSKSELPESFQKLENFHLQRLDEDNVLLAFLWRKRKEKDVERFKIGKE